MCTVRSYRSFLLVGPWHFNRCSKSHTLGPKGRPSTPTPIVPTPKTDKLITGPSIISYYYSTERFHNRYARQSYLAPQFCADQAMPSPVDPILLRRLSQRLTESNHLELVHIEMDTATWKRKNEGDEERNWRSEDRDWALTLNILVILGNSTSLNPS